MNQLIPTATRTNRPAAPDDGNYRWVEKQGETLGRSLIYAACFPLLLLSSSLSSEQNGYWWLPFALAFATILVLGLTSNRKKATRLLNPWQRFVPVLVILALLLPLALYDNSNSAEHLYWKLPLIALLAFFYASFFIPRGVKVPGKPADPHLPGGETLAEGGGRP